MSLSNGFCRIMNTNIWHINFEKNNNNNNFLTSWLGQKIIVKEHLEYLSEHVIQLQLMTSVNDNEIPYLKK